jgi:hypothetical protein
MNFSRFLNICGARSDHCLQWLAGLAEYWRMAIDRVNQLFWPETIIDRTRKARCEQSHSWANSAPFACVHTH